MAKLALPFLLLMPVVVSGLCRLLQAMARAGEALSDNVRKRWLASTLSRRIKNEAWKGRRAIETFRWVRITMPLQQPEREGNVMPCGTGWKAGGVTVAVSELVPPSCDELS